jgi:hypothetical protein
MSKCKIEGCIKYSTYGYDADSTSIRCTLHKEDGMINIEYMKSKCEHGKQKAYCIECKGASICQHNRQKSRCIECKGASICQHNRIKS